jgi:putative SOS response-associated peptidase YedK
MTLTRSGEEIAEYFDLAEDQGLPMEPDRSALRPRYNLAPSQATLAVRLEPGVGRVAEWRRWGLVPGWARDPAIGQKLFNARSETVAEKPSFRSAFRRQRCLVAVDGFYEWTPRSRDHVPHHFRPRQGILLGLAGLYESWSGTDGTHIESCTVLTTEAGPDVRPVHERMPVILGPESFAAWLDPESSVDRLHPLLVPAPEGSLERRAVGRTVNDPRRDEPACLEPDRPASPGPLFEPRA